VPNNREKQYKEKKAGYPLANYQKSNRIEQQQHKDKQKREAEKTAGSQYQKDETEHITTSNAGYTTTHSKTTNKRRNKQEIRLH
jgi:hypothetical protein